MTPHIFKPGDRVKCAFYGDEVFTLRESLNNSCWPIAITTDKKPPLNYEVFTRDGKLMHEHTHPVLTLVEAKREPVRIECEVKWVAWDDETGVIVPVVDKDRFTVGYHYSLTGKRGRLTFVESEGR